MKNKKFLFVCGVGRSGTTALCEALNLHDDIVLGVERYKYKMIGAGFPEHPERLFEKERFFSYEEEDTNIRMDSKECKGIYERAYEKFDNAVFVGDKTPGLYKVLPSLARGFPDCKVIYILRDPITVAFSWQNRADKGRPSWPAHNDYKASVIEWNRSLKIISSAREAWGDNMMLVNYETTFGLEAHALFPNLLEKLELDRKLTPDLQSFLDKSIQAAQRVRNVPDHIVEHVTEHADFGCFERLKALTV